MSAARPEFVPVAREPVHVELFDNPWVRVYEACIAPGHTTLDHLHDHDTVYVIVTGGTFRSVNSWRQRTVTVPGRSTGRLRTLGWLLRRFVTGWLRMPEGTLLWQPHASHPLVHRVTASWQNTEPVRMLGIELRTNHAPPTLHRAPGVRPESASLHSASYRIEAEATVEVPGQAVLTVIRGTVAAQLGTIIQAGETRWFAAGVTLTSATDTLAVLTLV